MTTAAEERNKAVVLEAFDTLFNRRDYAAAQRFWSPDYIQHSAHIEPGREGLFELVKASPPDMRYENGLPHAFINTILYLDYDRKGFPYPVVPFHVNCYGSSVIAKRGSTAHLTGEADPNLVDPPGPNPGRCFDVGGAVARAFADSLKGSVLVRWYPEMYHEVLHDPQRDSALGDVLAFVAARL